MAHLAAMPERLRTSPFPINHKGWYLPLLLIKTESGWWIETAPGMGVPVPADGGALTCREDLPEYLAALAAAEPSVSLPAERLAPMDQQEVWASGVTYFRSRSARMAESESSGGGDFYQIPHGSLVTGCRNILGEPRTSSKSGKLFHVHGPNDHEKTEGLSK